MPPLIKALVIIRPGMFAAAGVGIFRALRGPYGGRGQRPVVASNPAGTSGRWAVIKPHAASGRE